jgi:hypothetical protein
MSRLASPTFQSRLCSTAKTLPCSRVFIPYLR